MADLHFDEFDDGVGGGAEHAAVDPFADYQQPSSGVGFVDLQSSPQPTPSSPLPTSSSSPAPSGSFPFAAATASPPASSSSPSSASSSPATSRQKSPAAQGSGQYPGSPSPSSSSFHAVPPVDDENSPLRVWEREQRERLAERQAKAQEEHNKVRAAARAEIDKFYEERRLHCQKTAQHNRTAQAELRKDESGANSKGWARCVQLIDLNAGRSEGKDVSRMRKILLEAKHGALPLRAN